MLNALPTDKTLNKNGMEVLKFSSEEAILEGPEGWLPNQSSAYGLLSSMLACGRANLAAREEDPLLPHS